MFGISKPDHRSAIAVDIGSSSVGVAVVCLHADDTPEIIWEHREYNLIRSDASPAAQTKQIKTTLINAFLELSQIGMAALRNSGHSTDITEVQALISAPWSYTITKTINLKDEHPFTVTEDTLSELVESARKQSKLTFATNKLAAELGLVITHGDVINVAVNEYSVTDPTDQKGRTLSLSYLETAISEHIIETLEDTVNKFFPKAKQSNYSFMYAFYLTLKHMHPNTSEICLIDVTGEATEIGIVRDNTLKHTSFVSAGTYTIARDLAEACSIPKEEAYSYMKDSPDEIVERLPKRSSDKVQEVLNSYQEHLADLFSRTGDILTIPKTIFLHTDVRTEEFFINQITRAAHAATGVTHTIHPFTTKVLDHAESNDSAVLVAVNFLAKKEAYFTLLPKDN